MAYVPGMAKDLWPRTVQIKEKEKAYRACQRNWQRLQLKMNESNDRNQESPKKGVSGKWRGKMCLFFKRKKKSIHIAFSPQAADQGARTQRLHITETIIARETEILKNKCHTGTVQDSTNFKHFILKRCNLPIYKSDLPGKHDKRRFSTKYLQDSFWIFQVPFFLC